MLFLWSLRKIRMVCLGEKFVNRLVNDVLSIKIRGIKRVFVFQSQLQYVHVKKDTKIILEYMNSLFSFLKLFFLNH